MKSVLYYFVDNNDTTLCIIAKRYWHYNGFNVFQELNNILKLYNEYQNVNLYDLDIKFNDNPSIVRALYLSQVLNQTIDYSNNSIIKTLLTKTQEINNSSKNEYKENADYINAHYKTHFKSVPFQAGLRNINDNKPTLIFKKDELKMLSLFKYNINDTNYYQNTIDSNDLHNNRAILIKINIDTMIANIKSILKMDRDNNISFIKIDEDYEYFRDDFQHHMEYRHKPNINQLSSVCPIPITSLEEFDLIENADYLNKISKEISNLGGADRYPSHPFQYFNNDNTEDEKFVLNLYVPVQSSSNLLCQEVYAQLEV